MLGVADALARGFRLSKHCHFGTFFPALPWRHASYLPYL
jgi:hypothetical protein